MKPFGDNQEPSLTQVIGHLEALVERDRKANGPIEARLSLVERALELLQIADEGSPSDIRRALWSVPERPPATDELIEVLWGVSLSDHLGDVAEALGPIRSLTCQFFRYPPCAAR